MAIIKSIEKCINNISPNEDILFRYTKKIDFDSEWINTLLNNHNNIFYINYSDASTYIAIGRSKEYIINSNNDFEELKKYIYKIESYGENTTETLKLFGGVSFDINQEPSDFWAGIPKGLFFIPEFLISKDKETYFISYYKFLNQNSNPKKINLKYQSFISKLEYISDLQKTLIHFDKDIPSKENYSKIFFNLSQSIKNKDIEKIVLSRIKKFSVNNKIILQDSSCTNFYIDLEKNKRFLGTTPELLVTIKNKQLTTSAIAGTLKKESGNDLNDFLNNQKELSEHQYVVDDLVKKISNYCKIIDKKNKPEILELKHLYHLCTPIKAQLKKNIHILDIANILHPTPAVSGTPKDKTLDMIIKNEPFHRGWYSGYIGWYDIKGDGRFDVAIRSALQIDKHLYCYAGGGLVKDSQEIHEWNETELKFQHLLSAIK